MDSLFILIQLEVLIQFYNFVSQFHNPSFQFLIDLWIKIPKISNFSLNVSLKGKGFNPFNEIKFLIGI